jgi:Flp pilus assembly protein TadB
MSRERARRREERAQQAAHERAARERREARAARRRHTAAALRGRLPRRVRYRGQQGLLARRRRAQNAVIVLLYLAVQAIVWLVWADPWARAAAALVGLFAVPVLVTLTLDRRSHS